MPKSLGFVAARALLTFLSQSNDGRRVLALGLELTKIPFWPA